MLVTSVACLLLLGSQVAWALGLGDITVRSYLGQPLNARIELISRSPSELEDISANLASADSFRLVGLDRMALSVPLSFTVHPDSPDAWVEVRSLDAVNDPVLQFVIEVNFPNGRLLRQYTVFLDPPTVAAPVPLPSLTPRREVTEAPSIIDEPIITEDRSTPAQLPEEPPAPVKEPSESAPPSRPEPSSEQPMVSGSEDVAEGIKSPMETESVSEAGDAADALTERQVEEASEVSDDEPRQRPGTGPVDEVIEEPVAESIEDLVAETTREAEEIASSIDTEMESTDTGDSGEQDETFEEAPAEPGARDAEADYQAEDTPVEPDAMEPDDAEPAEEELIEPDAMEPDAAEPAEEEPIEPDAMEPDAAEPAEEESIASAAEDESPADAGSDESAEEDESDNESSTAPDAADETEARMEQDLTQAPADRVEEQVPMAEEESVPVPAPAPVTYQATQADLEAYGPVQRGQTLWGIATEFSQGTDYSINQVMLAIQRVNPEAFGRENINLLKQGAILRRPPSSEVERMTARVAMLEAMRQADDYAEILAGRIPETRSAPVLADPATSAEPAIIPKPASAGEVTGRLELVPPDEAPADRTAAGASGASEEGKTGVENGPQAVMLNEEEIDSATQESEYLSHRLEELREELGEDAAMVEVEDKGLAEMEQSLRDQRTSDATETPVTASPPRETPAWYSSYGWWLLIALLLFVGVLGAWWLRRGKERAGAEAAAVADVETVMGEDAVDAAPVIELEDYIGHVGDENGFEDESDANVGDGEAPEGLEDLPEPAEGDLDREPDEPSSFDGSADERRHAETPGEEPGDLQSDDSGLDESVPNDPETKLDLARAHIAMGDTETVRELLEEVISEGNEDQVNEAHSMMEEI